MTIETVFNLFENCVLEDEEDLRLRNRFSYILNTCKFFGTDFRNSLIPEHDA